MTDETDYGPLAQLIGSWSGGDGLDIAPEPDGEERNPYHETIVYTGVGEVSNAESQTLMGVHYIQEVKRNSNDKVFHHQTGYWLWDREADVVMHSFVIPRAVAVVAGGSAAQGTGAITTIEVAASTTDSQWSISQSPFMEQNARTTAFNMQLEVDSETLSYRQTTMVDIYDRSFEHTDENKLRRV